MGSDQSSTILQDPPAKPGETPIICSPNYEKVPEILKKGLYQDFPEGVTMYHLFEDSFKKYPDYNIYGHRVYSDGKWQDRFEFITRAQFRQLRDSVGAYFNQHECEEGEKIGILSYNKIEWVATQHACFAYGCIPVPIYDTYGLENIAYIINHSSIRIVFVVSSKLRELLELRIERVRHIVVFDNEEQPYKESDFAELLEGLNCTITKWDDVMKITDRYPHKPPTYDTPAAIMYTSGTTGPPKGCIVTHGNFIGTASTYIHVYPFCEKDCLLSFLPLAHVYEEVLHFVAVHSRTPIAFYSGSIPRLIDEIKILKPSLFISVARVFERIYEGMQKNIAKKPFLTRMAFKSAFAIKSFLLDHFRLQKVPILDSVFNAINKQAVGGDMRMFICGGSALSVEIQHFLRISLNVYFLQGYGLTETAAGVTVQSCTDTLDGNVGVLLHCVQAKMKDLPDMGYSSKNFEGELFIRGATLFHGYYKDEQKTKEAFDEDGWFRTGDIFRLNKTGQFQVIGRAKELVKLSQGEYISLAKLQNCYVDVKYVNQIYVHAAMTSRFLVAVVVLDKHQPGYDKVTVDQMLQLLEDKAIEMQFNGYERICNLILTTEEFTPQNGMLTPSLKLVLYKIAKRYEKEIDGLLKENRLRKVSERHQHSD